MTYASGEVWTYKARPADGNSRVLILRVETLDGRTVVHIAVQGVILDATGATRDVHHIPMTKEALAGSLLKLEAVGVALPDYLEGYRVWRSAFDQGKAGVLSIPVSAVVDAIAQAWAKGTSVT